MFAFAAWKVIIGFALYPLDSKTKYNIMFSHPTEVICLPFFWNAGNLVGTYSVQNAYWLQTTSRFHIRHVHSLVFIFSGQID